MIPPMATSAGQSSSGIDGIIIALDLVYAATYLLFGALKAGYAFYFRIMKSSRPRTPILRYWLALAVFIGMVACGWIFVGAYWVFEDCRSWLAERVTSKALRIALFAPLYVLLIAGGWLVVGAYSLLKRLSGSDKQKGLLLAFRNFTGN